MKIKQNMISTKPVLHGFMVLSWILYAGIKILLKQSGIHVCLDFFRGENRALS